MSDNKGKEHRESQPEQALTWHEAEKIVLSTDFHKKYGYPLLLLLKKPGLFQPEKRRLFHTRLRDQPERYFLLVTSLSERRDPAKSGERQQHPQPPIPIISEHEIELSREIVEGIEARIGMLSIPLRVENLTMHWMDGTDHVIWVHNWAGQCQFTWNVEAPKEWVALESLFHEVWELGPADYGPFVRVATSSGH